MPRLFTAIEVPHDIAQALSMLRGGLTGARWIDQENYHVTLRFIGDVEHHMADEAARSLSEIRRTRFEMRLNGLDVFGGKKPHSLFASVSADPALYELQADIQRRFQRIGVPADPRKFTPHVTVARLKRTSPEAAANFLSLRGGFFSTPFEVKRFVLMSSRDSVGGGPYIVEDSYDLAPRGSGAAAASVSAMASAPSWMWR